MKKTRARTNLRCFRTAQKMSQEDFAFKLGVNRSGYALIESGSRGAKQDFWEKLQKAFDVPDSEMWGLMKLDDE